MGGQSAHEDEISKDFAMNALSNIQAEKRASARALEVARRSLRRQLAGHSVGQLSELAHVCVELLYASSPDHAADEAHEVVIGLQDGLAELVGIIERGRN